MTRPLAVMIGSIGKLPLAGVSYYFLHYLVGLEELGYQVHYLERQNWQGECYDPDLGGMTDDTTYALHYLGSVMSRFGIPPERYSFVDLEGQCHGSGWSGLRAALDRADFVLTVANPTWFDELERCERRAYVDGDPLFTQVAMVTGEGTRAQAPFHYDTLFTYAARIGSPDCTVPTAGRKWNPTRPVVATRLWDAATTNGSSGSSSGDRSLPVTALLHWAAGSDVTYEGRVYGHKDQDFERFIDLPRRTNRSFVLAVGGGAPRERLREHGWDFVGPLGVSKTLEAYRQFIAGSRADLGIAKHAYVASRSGWFSDRGTCFLAAGRPVLHQDTGLGDWLPTGEGVLVFSDVDGVIEALDRLDRDYERHARAARIMAETHFEAAKVIGSMLDQAGYR